MNTDRVGILGYGAYIPWERITTEKIVRERQKGSKDLSQLLDKVRNGLLLRYKSVASWTEDTITMATEAAENALAMSGIDPKLVQSVVAGSESKPYAVGTTARHVASFLGIGENVYVADVEAACNAGMQGLNFVQSQVRAGVIDYGLAVASDVAQAPKGDPLEYSAGAGAGAFIVGKGDAVATIEDMAPYSSLTLDFWRREGAEVPSHFGRTTVEAYISHVIGAISELLKRNPGVHIRDFDHITFHQPSGYMPLKTCKVLCQENIEQLPDPRLEDRIRLTPEDVEWKVKPWLRVLDTGNTYAASTLISISSILDKAKPGEDILAVSYGSGAYTIATWLRVRDAIESVRGLTPSVEDYVARKKEIELKTYHDHLSERIRSVKRRISLRRIVAEIEPLGEEYLTATLCDGCERVFFPARAKCLQADCPGPCTQFSFPKRASLKNYKKISFKKRWTSNFDLLKMGKFILVDSSPVELKPDLELEVVIRKLDYEGKHGLIIYGPSYRPNFRKAAPQGYGRIPVLVRAVAAI